ncbi:hypothetical protein [Candidatus Palauibacter sp.]|uniref:hypothetical protein n=1 Tax=Candidatus Palauibacter sp. TaxID=3101350 RepID=UPI003B02B258
MPPEAPPRFRLRVGPVLLVAGVSAAGFLGCSDSLWEPAPTGGDAWALAPVGSQTGLSADVDSLPPWQTVIQGIGGPGCEFYFGTATGSYVSRKYVLEFSAEAKGDTDEVWVQQHEVLVTVSRPTSDGGKEVLPKRVAVLAVCLLPGTERGSQETTGSVKAILKDVGIPLPDKMWAAAQTREDGRWAEFWRLASGWVVPSSLAAQDPDPCQDPEPSTLCEPTKMKEINVETGRTCPVGLDYDAWGDNCVLNYVGKGMEETVYLIPPGSIKTFLGLGGRNDGGDGGDDGDDGDRPVAFNLNCNSPSRGSTGGCYVTTTDTAVTLSDLSYAWQTGAGVARPAETDADFTRWAGTATSTISLTVSISGPDVADKTLTGVVEVGAGMLAFPAGRTVPVYDTPHTGSWASDEWGRFAVSIPAVVTGKGSGPWQGTSYVSWPTETIIAQLYIHPDLKLTDPGRPWVYETTGVVTAHELRERCDHHAQLDAVATLYEANETCGTSAARSSFHDPLKGHEEEHASRYETCRVSQDIRDKLEQIAAALGADTERANRLINELERTMRDGIDFNVAEVTSPGRFWHYRWAQGWVLDTATALGHSGAECP